MSFFHESLSKIEKDLMRKTPPDAGYVDPKAYQESITKNIDDHLQAINEEFQIETKAHELLVKYYNILKEARALVQSYGSNLHDNYDQRREVINKIAAARELVGEIEKWIRAENAEHKFLR